jgi:hypothetical protein
LKLLAGDVNVVTDIDGTMDRPMYGAPKVKAPAKSRPEFTEASLFEYHLYTLQRPASVRNKETKQLSLLEGFDIPVKKVIAFESWTNANDPNNGTVDLESAVKVKFVNSEKSHLGMPMPAGKVRLYQRDAGGSLQFLGEDQIQHTPRDEKLSLTVGKSFDIKASHSQTNFTKTSKRSSVSTYEVEVRNRKKTAETATVYEHFGTPWTITSKTDPYVKEDSNTAAFQVNLKAGEVKKIKFTVKAKW